MLATTPQSDHVSIHSLSVRAESGLADRLVSQLQTESWTVPRPDEWIFIRSLAVTADASQIHQQTRQLLGHACRQTVDGDSGAAPAANAIRFRNLPELLAVLISDLLQGKAAQRWYWLQWRHLLARRPIDAVVQLFREHVQFLPAITDQLQQRGRLTQIWQALDAAGAESIYQQLLLLGTPRSKSTGGGFESSGIERLARLLSLQKVSVNAWRDALTNHDKDQPQFRLAAAILALQYFPDLLFDNPQIAQLALQTLVFKQSSTADRCAASGNFAATEGSSGATRDTYANLTTPLPPLPASRRPPPAVTAPEDAALRPSAAQYSEVTAAAKTLSGKAGSTTALPARCSTGVPGSEVSPNGATLSTRVRADVVTSDPTGDCAGSTAVRREGQFVTAFGGCFYLINVITRYIEQLSGRGDSLQAAQGWLWLYGLTSCFAVNPDTPLLRFIANQAGLEDYSLLDQWRVPANYTVENYTVENYTSENCLRLFKQLRLQEPQLWHSDLLRVPATIYYTSSHVDCVYPLSGVRLPIRVAGLDINPNWVAWLGRVVTFHYRDSSPAAEEQP